MAPQSGPQVVVMDGGLSSWWMYQRPTTWFIGCTRPRPARQGLIMRRENNDMAHFADGRPVLLLAVTPGASSSTRG